MIQSMFSFCLPLKTVKYPSREGLKITQSGVVAQNPDVFQKDLPKILNFHQVTNTLYRSGEPGLRDDKDENDPYLQANDLLYLKNKLQIDTIVDLRKSKNDYYSCIMKKEEELARSLGMEYINIPLSSKKVPTIEDREKFYRIIKDNEKRQKKVLVHCKSGFNRTGMMVAYYKIDNMGWDRKKSYDEMIALGFKRSDRINHL